MLHKLNPAVLRTAFVGGVVSKRFVGAFADRDETIGANALLHQAGDDGLGALLAKRVIDSVGAGVVAVALDFELQ